MYSLMSVAKLKSELRNRHASTTGKKAALIERLEAYDRNFECRAADLEPTTEPVYECPHISTFKDINADSPIPPLNRHEIQSYFERFSAQPKGKDMYEARCLLTARYAKVGSFTYVQGQSKASMKKCTCVVNVKINGEGNIEQGNCECAAGSGIQAHCKHVHVLLCAVEDIVRTKTIILHQVSTQSLMSFKRPSKLYYRSPIKAQHLPTIHSRKRKINYEPLNEIDIMPNYNNYVRNLAINYGPSSMPILQTFAPANPYALEFDHCYSSTSSEDKLLETLYLKNVSKEKIAEIERSTRGQHNSPEWHRLRSCRATASKFHLLWHAQTGIPTYINNILCPKEINSRSITHGRINEEIALKKYEHNFNLKVDRSGLHISVEYPFLAATPDGLLGEETVIEVKCPYAARNKQITPISVPYLEEVGGRLLLKKNHPYYAQIQGQLLCTGRKYVNFIIYTYKEMKILFISRDNEYISEMLSALKNFYDNHLEEAILNKFFYKGYVNTIKNTSI